MLLIRFILGSLAGLWAVVREEFRVPNSVPQAQLISGENWSGKVHRSRFSPRRIAYEVWLRTGIRSPRIVARVSMWTNLVLGIAITMAAIVAMANPFVNDGKIRTYVRRTLAKIIVATAVLGAGELMVDEQGNVYGGNGTTQIKNLFRLAKLTDLDLSFVNATQNTYGHTITATTVSDQVAALNLLIKAVPSGTLIVVPSGVYGIASSIELLNKVTLQSAFMYSVRFQAMSGYTDHQMCRDWQLADYTVGESDHTLAPTNTTTPIYYVSLRGGIAFDVNGASNVTCVALVHIQERSMVEVVFDNRAGATGSGNRGLALYSNADAAGNCAGRYTVIRLIHYGAGWDHFVRADGSNGGKQPTGMLNDLKLIDFTSAPGGAGANYNDSPFYIQQASNVDLDIHCEGSPPAAASDSAIIRLVDVAGCAIRGTLNSGGYDMFRPYVRATSTGTLPAPWKALSPEIDHLNIGGVPHSGVGNIIEDEIPVKGVATTRHFAYDATLFASVRIVHYDGASMKYLDKFNVLHEDKLPDVSEAPTGAVAETMPRGRVSNAAYQPPSGRLVLVAAKLYVGQVVTSIKWTANTTASSGRTHSWAALFDASRNKLAVSADDTSGEWAASTTKTFTLTSPYTVTISGTYYFGLVIVATTTVNSVVSHAEPNILNGISPIRNGLADSSLTDPTTCPTTAASLSNVSGNNVPYGYAI